MGQSSLCCALAGLSWICGAGEKGIGQALGDCSLALDPLNIKEVPLKGSFFLIGHTRRNEVEQSQPPEMLLNKALIISALLFQTRLFAELFALLRVGLLIPGCPHSAER